MGTKNLINTFRPRVAAKHTAKIDSMSWQIDPSKNYSLVLTAVAPNPRDVIVFWEIEFSEFSDLRKAEGRERWR